MHAASKPKPAGKRAAPDPAAPPARKKLKLDASHASHASHAAADGGSDPDDNDPIRGRPSASGGGQQPHASSQPPASLAEPELRQLSVGMGLRVQQVQAVLGLMQQGCSVPFIAR